MKKQLLLLVMMLLPMVAMADKSGTCGADLIWTLVESTGTLTISGTGAMNNYYDDDSYRTPWYNDRAIIIAVVIENGVTSIGQYAFYNCTGLTSFTIPNSVTSIGGNAFAGCSGLTSVTIGNSVTTIGYYAFYSCSSLASVTIGNSVTSIGNDAFYGCSELSSIVVENGNSVYDSRGNCNAIIETSTNTLVTGCKSTIIPNSVTSIGDGAFSGCTGLTSVIIPNSVTSIGYGVFSCCSELNSIVVENGNSVYDSRGNCNAIIETSTNTLVIGCKSTIIPNSVTSIGGGAYAGSSLTSIDIPNSVTSIREYNQEIKGETNVEIIPVSA